MLYDNAEDANRYLQGSWVLYNGYPYAVNAVNMVPIRRNMTVQLQPGRFNPPPYAEIINVAIEDPQLSMLNYDLGYCNAVFNNEPHAAYISRLPVRGQGYKQGLHQNNCQVHILDRRQVRFQDLTATKGFVEMCRNEYPSLGDIAVTLSKAGNGGSIAFNKHFAIGFDPELEDFTYYHRGEALARADNLNLLRLPKSKHYLREFLEYSGVKVA